MGGNKIKLYYYTLIHLKRQQIFYRIYYFFYKKLGFLQLPSSFPSQSCPIQFMKMPYSKHFLGKNHFSFLNISHRFSMTIKWDYMEKGKLWAYNLNYFNFLNEERMTKEIGMGLIVDFIHQIDNNKIALDPYPISLRVINWIVFLSYYDIRDERINLSIYRQLRLLNKIKEYHLLGNHLLENGFSLFFGGVYFKDKKLYQSAKKILKKELKEQILSDGGHFELSPMYHQTILFGLLKCIVLCRQNKIDWTDETFLLFLEKKAEKMLGWLLTMTFKNGKIPLFNDSAEEIAFSTKIIQNWAEKLNLIAKKVKLEASGYRKYFGKEYEIVLDIGEISASYVPGHTHSDIFNFELYKKEIPVIVDTGLSTYEICDRRQIERSTSSHNTVTIGNFEQSEIWASFRVARRTRPKILEETQNSIEGRINYKTAKAQHKRIFILKEKEIIIKDRVKSKKKATAHFHFSPQERLFLKKNRVVFSNGEILFKGEEKIKISNFKYAPKFNVLISSKKVEVTFKNYLETKIIL